MRYQVVVKGCVPEWVVFETDDLAAADAEVERSWSTCYLVDSSPPEPAVSPWPCPWD